jgi:hypothetical protein
MGVDGRVGQLAAERPRVPKVGALGVKIVCESLPQAQNILLLCEHVLNHLVSHFGCKSLHGYPRVEDPRSIVEIAFFFFRGRLAPVTPSLISFSIWVSDLGLLLWIAAVTRFGVTRFREPVVTPVPSPP